MENSQLFRITSDRRIIFKKPKILSQINIKEIQLRNDPGNFLHLGSKSFNIRQRYLTSRKVKKNDVEGQINLLSDLINNYSSSSIKNLFLIQKLKDENDFLIDELNHNIKKNTLFNKTTKEIFNDLVIQYEKRGYKIPSLTLENNLFKKSPLLIETKKDVDEFYKTNSDVQGNYIVDMNKFPEKNWNFLKKLKKVVDSYGDKFTPSNSKWDKRQNVSNDFYSNKKALSEKKEREKISREIKILKNLIEIQEKDEKNEIENYFSSKGNKKDLLYTNNNKILNKSIKSKFYLLDVKGLIKNRLLNQKYLKRNKSSLKNQNTDNTIQKRIIVQKMRKKLISKTIKDFYRNNKNNKKNKIEGKTLITSLREKHKNNRILSYTEQMYHKINKKKLNELLSVEGDIIEYLKKKNYVISKMNLDNFNKDFSKRVYDIKSKIKKQDLSTAFNHHLADYGNKGFKILEKIQDTEKTIEEMDKYLAKHIINKYFEE